jgi:hypothetical protein
MSNSTIYIRAKNQELWDTIPNKSDFINNVLSQLRYQQQQKEKAKMREQQNEETNAKNTTTSKEPTVQA